MTQKVVIEAQYFPPIASFIFLIEKEVLYLEAHENYQKHSFRNRCNILNSNGICSLSIPLLKGKNRKSPILETSVADFEPWQSNHIRSLQSAYGKSPYYEHYMPYIRDLIIQPYTSIFTLNEQIIIGLIEILEIDISIKRTSGYYKTYDPTYLDLRNIIKPKNSRNTLAIQKYEQVFSDRHDFVPNLSILDLLFCLGPESIFNIQESFKLNRK